MKSYGIHFIELLESKTYKGLVPWKVVKCGELSTYFYETDKSRVTFFVGQTLLGKLTTFSLEILNKKHDTKHVLNSYDVEYYRFLTSLRLALDNYLDPNFDSIDILSVASNELEYELI